jgi:hypothetical protein
MLGASSGCNSISLSTPSLPGRLPLVETIHKRFISRLAACVFSFLAFTKPSQISLIELIVLYHGWIADAKWGDAMGVEGSIRAEIIKLKKTFPNTAIRVMVLDLVSGSHG